MKYVEAFNKLGYQVRAPRTDWTAEKIDGVCLTLWKSEVTWLPTPPSMDLWQMYRPGENKWEKLPGHTRRTEHLNRSWNEFGGAVDVVLVSGTPGEGVKVATPWIASQREGYQWRLTKFDRETGFFAVKTEKKMK